MADVEGDPTCSSPVKYHRRLDRGPDRNFKNLDQDSQVLLSMLRNALEEAKSRIVRLRDENDEK